MKNINKTIILIIGLIILFSLKLVFIDRNVIDIVLSVAYLGFFLITCINYFRKKETILSKKYITFILTFLVIVQAIQTGILLFNGKSILNSVFTLVVLWMEVSSLRKILFKKEFNARKVYVAAVMLRLILEISKFNFSIGLISNVVVGCLVMFYFYNSERKYFGLFDASLLLKSNDKFKYTQWIKTFVIVLTGIIYLVVPVLGCILGVILWLLCFGGLFDGLILIHEQNLYNKKIRKNKIFVASRKVYHYAESKNDYLKIRLENVAKKHLLEEGIPYETYALMEEKAYRVKEKNIDINFSNINELLKETKKLIKKNVRPEVINKLLVSSIDKCEGIKITNKKKISKKITSRTNDFYKRYKEIVEEDKDISEKVSDVNELYKKYCDKLLESIK